MEEIENRFEIIRIAVKLADYETIEVQIKQLRNMSTDRRLHEILVDLSSRNFRQALYAMRDYADSLRDDFFTPSVPERTASGQGGVQQAAARVEEDLFSLTDPTPPPVSPPSPSASTSSSQPASNEKRVLGLEEMFQMTHESARAPRGYTDPVAPGTPAESASTSSQPDPAQGIFDASSEPKSPSTDADPLFTLDQVIPEEEKSAPTPTDETPAAEPASQPTPPPSSEEAEHPAVPAEAAPLFEADDTEDFITFTTEEPEAAEAAEEALAPQEASTPAETPQPEPAEDAAPASSEPAGSGMFTLDEAEPVAAEEPVSTPPQQHPSQTEEADAVNAQERPQPTDATVAEKAPADAIAAEQESPPEAEPAASEPQGPRRWEIEPDFGEELYEKFAFMGQKFRNMMHQYPQLEEYEGGITQEVQDFIHMVSTRDYGESQIVAAIERYQELKEQGKLAEAAQMLIAAATTESTFAQFMLARELFKGEVLQQNHPEAFTQINRLAEEDYPEAICDLGQLYEYGIGIDKNKRHALLLYEEAAEMGVERAKTHYERLKGSNPLASLKSLTKSLLSKKK